MWQTIILKRQNKNSSDEGFITIEIIIALFIAFAFLAVSLQTMVAAMVFKVGAQEEQRADKLIQEEIEELNNLGSTLVFGVNTTDACNGVLNIDGDGSTADDGYAQGLWNVLNGNTVTTPATNTTYSDTANILGKTLTITGTQVIVPAAASPTPHRILGISYQVTKPDVDGNGIDEIITNRYVEVVPDAALECS